MEDETRAALESLQRWIDKTNDGDVISQYSEGHSDGMDKVWREIQRRLKRGENE